jgi:hypothetical protein
MNRLVTPVGNAIVQWKKICAIGASEGCFVREWTRLRRNIFAVASRWDDWSALSLSERGNGVRRNFLTTAGEMSGDGDLRCLDFESGGAHKIIRGPALESQATTHVRGVSGVRFIWKAMLHDGDFGDVG